MCSVYQALSKGPGNKANRDDDMNNNIGKCAHVWILLFSPYLGNQRLHRDLGVS